MLILQDWCSRWKREDNHEVIMSGHDDYDNPKGVGYAKESSCPTVRWRIICVFKMQMTR